MKNYVINARCLIEIARGDETSKAVQWLKSFNEKNKNTEGTIDVLILNSVSEVNAYTYAYKEYEDKDLAIALSLLRGIFKKARLDNISHYKYYELSERLSEEIGKTQAKLVSDGEKWPLEAIAIRTIAEEENATILASKKFTPYFTEFDVEVLT